MSKIRTFIAVETPPDIRRRAMALIERLRASQAKVRWSDPDSMHLTLNFLGEAAAPFASFDLELQGIGAFPSTGRPRTLWLGAGEGAEEIVLLQTAITKSLAPLGFRPEARRFRPHLTLGRVRDSHLGLDELAELMKQHADFNAGSTPVDEVVVFSSRLERAGAVHERLGAGALAG